MNRRGIARYLLARSGRLNGVDESRQGRARPQRPTADYVICTNPRSGSWLLSEGLGSTRLAGNPREWFNVLEEQEHRARWRTQRSADLSYATYLALVREQSTTNNGICGVKLMYHEFAELPRKLEALGVSGTRTPAEAMAKLFPQARHLWLTRRDKARQAISLLIASRTSQWWSIQGVTTDAGDVSIREPEFDAHAIARLEQGLTENDAGWQTYFTEREIVPRVVYYEDFAADYGGTIASVLTWLGVPDADTVPIPPSRFNRQSTERNEEWLARYAAYKSKGGLLENNPAPDQTSRRMLACQSDDAGSVPTAWHEWIVRSKGLGHSDPEIFETPPRNGIAAAAAQEAVTRTGSGPNVQQSLERGTRLSKAASLLNVQQQLARLSSQANIIERRHDMGGDEFRDSYYAANRPVILENRMNDWAALTRWTPDYLKTLAGDLMVEVMTGRTGNPDYEWNGGKHRTQVRFADYVDRVYSGTATNDYYMVANNGFLQKAEAQALFEDFTAFPEYLDPATLAGRCFLWFGPAGTVTPLHHDTSNILLAQVRGRKRLRLIPANQWQYVYNTRGVFSDVDCANPDPSRHPLFRHATAIDIILAPGEVLFLPVGWWHWVGALDVSMTVSFTNFRYDNQFAWE